MLQLYFIRHGQSTNNAYWETADRDNYLDGRSTDPDLTATGHEQAKLVAEFLAQPYQPNPYDPQNRYGFGLTHLYCSLMIRAIKTGQAISEKTKVRLVALPEVHETGGIFESGVVDGEPVFIGMPGPGKSYFQTHFPDLMIPEDLPEEGWWNREKEPREHYLVRAQSVIDRLLDQHQGQEHRVGVVMHGGIFARIIVTLFNVQAEKFWFLMNNCAISRVDIDEEGHVVLVYMNRADFLPDHLLT